MEGVSSVGMKHIAAEYEPKNFQSFRETMKPGQLVYDIGAYDGITSVIAGQTVGASNVVIIEPAEMNWATIRAYWQAHDLSAPRATYAGFLSEADKSGLDPKSVVVVGGFPVEAEKSSVAQYEEGLNFRLLNDRTFYPEVAARPNLTLDTVASIAGMPAGITMDVEGAEFLVLQGAVEVLKAAHPRLWISVHPDFMRERFHHDPVALHIFLNRLGYKETLLAKDHEEHWLWECVDC